MINLTLNQLKRPALSNLVPKFGTKVEKNDINKGGLSTEEVDRNITLPFELMREVEVSSSDTTTKIQYDAKIAIVGSDPVTLTLDKASYKGCVITITNRSTEQATIVLSEDNQKNLESKKSLALEFDGTVWNDTALVVDSTVSEESNKPVSSAAVYQKATEITEAYTQAIASETTARSEAITAVEQKVTEETSARTQADTALGTRIDEEVAARTEADTQLGTRIDTEVGTLSALTTTAKDNVVAAINELDADIGNEVTARTDADTALGTRIDTEVGTLSALTTTAKDNVVAAINEVNGKVGTVGGDTSSTATNCEQFSFVVDSNEKLAAWANATEGNDYTSVLIKKGEWTSNTGVNLTTAGTKVVVGEPGSKLVFNDVEKGLYYGTTPTESEYYMRDVTVNVTSRSGFGDGSGFHSCANLTNCTGTVAGHGFHSCANLTNCTGTGTGYGFRSCTNLTNCIGIGIGDGDGDGYGFISCTNLTNCIGSGSGSGSGFYSCGNLTNCTGYGSGTGTGSGSGLRSCTNLTNCTGSGYGSGIDSGDGYGFISCINLTNCTGTGTGSGSGTGYGFSTCKVVIGCKAGGHCTTNVFQDCYASSSETSTYACADTPNGGFNNTTNPAA